MAALRLAFALALARPLAAAPPAIVPRPASVTPRACVFALDGRTALVADPALESAARRFREELSPATGFAFPRARRGSAGVVEMRLVRQPALGPEDYTLDVKEKRITILASDPAGAFYAVQTLRQMLPADVFRRAPVPGVRWEAPCARVEDRPRFGWRGALVDVARHFMPKDTLFKFIDVMALYKLNTLHLHLTDDQGWRVEIKRYPRLTAASADYDLSWTNGEDATRSPSEQPGGYYTQDDIRELVAYAAARHVTIVPEIEMPGHSGAAIRAYPELGNAVQVRAAGADASALSDENVTNVEDATLVFLKNVLDEVLELFPSRFIHIGGDEVYKGFWKANPAAQARMKALGLANEEELQSWFIKQIDAYLTSKGRRATGWDEILEGGLAPGATVTSWRGTQGGIAAAKSGHDVVMSPSEHTYLDYYQSKVTGLEPKAIGGQLPLAKVYAFEPVPPELSPDEAKRVLGAQASLWTEFIPSRSALEYMALPRLPAFSETVWSPKDARDWDDFQTRISAHFEKFSRLDVRARPLVSDPEPAARWKPAELGADWSVREWDATPFVKESGPYKVLFQVSGNDQTVSVRWVELLEDGKTVARSDRPQRTGGPSYESWRNLFELAVAARPGARYALRASLKADKPELSAGELYLVPANPARRVP